MIDPATIHGLHPDRARSNEGKKKIICSDKILKVFNTDGKPQARYECLP